MSDSSESPVPFDLEFLRKDAKRLTRACRAGHGDALARLRQSLPRMATLDNQTIASNITLADAQQAIARERGRTNWAALKRAGEPLEQLLVAVRGGDLAAITSSLDTGRALARDSVHAACALGDSEALSRHLEQDPTLASTLHRGWPVLAYACASPVHRLSGRHSAGLLECARVLIDGGADVNAVVPAESARDTPTPVAFLAMKNGNMAVMMLLQRRGADERALGPLAMSLPQANQAWSGTIAEFYARPDVREEVRARIAAWQGNDPWRRGHHTPLDLRELHDVTASTLTPSFSSVPAWAMRPVDRYSPDALLVGITHTFPPALVELLLSRGFDCRTARVGGRTLAAAATRAGRHEVVALLRAHGVPDDDVTPLDTLIGACMRLDADDAGSVTRVNPNVLERLIPGDIDLLVAAACAGATEHLRLFLDVGMPADAAGTAGIAPLHGAAWHGRVETVRLLLERGAPVDARDMTYDETPRAWAAHGAVHCRTAENEYREVLWQLGVR